ncbi:hypothetical protein SCLCIDRAFT_208576 [Scleroderma citrinum Foug A]|uniref:Uncharacterized protein n=1 Tax=Scleroderma citrinum Foug A TaxID=1036808 RepID=A0A0C2ZW43_9AGAM|nr:hypothetical protein SCLCIDRAFT_208576 [Scleroderma citrinum Foug A]
MCVALHHPSRDASTPCWRSRVRDWCSGCVHTWIVGGSKGWDTLDLLFPSSGTTKLASICAIAPQGNSGVGVVLLSVRFIPVCFAKLYFVCNSQAYCDA